jgi:hypothetical protein
MVRSFPGHGGGVSRVLFTADGKQLVAAGGSFDPSILVYDTATARELGRLEGHTNFVGDIALAPDGQSLASVGWDATARLWDVRAGKERRRWPRFAGSPSRVAFAADASGLLAEPETGTVCLFDLTTGKPRRRLAGFGRWLGTSPDGRTLAVATTDNLVTLVEVATSQERRRFGSSAGQPDWAVIAPEGRRLLTDGGDGTAFLWDLTAGVKGGLAARDGDDLWRALAEDGRPSYDAHWKLVLSPRESVPLLRANLRPASPVDVTRLARWVAELDDDSFTVREKATQRLERAGEAARDALEKVLAGPPSAEVRRRAEALLAKLDEGTPGPEEARELRALEVLEAIGTPEARHVVEGLAKGAPEARLTRDARGVLERLPK